MLSIVNGPNITLHFDGHELTSNNYTYTLPNKYNVIPSDQFK